MQKSYLNPKIRFTNLVPLESSNNKKKQVTFSNTGLPKLNLNDLPLWSKFTSDILKDKKAQYSDTEF